MGWTVIKDGRRACITCCESKALSDFYSYRYTTTQGKSSRRYDSRCRDCARARRLARFYRDHSRALAVSQEWKKRNAEHVKAYAAAYRALPESRKAHNFHQRIRQAKSRASGEYSQQDIDDLMAKQRGKCAACRKSVRKTFHVDHILAIANGGANDKHNLQILCPYCNCSKQDKDAIKWAQENGRLL